MKLAALTKALSADERILVAIVFGSQAKGSATRRSDLDLGLALAKPMSIDEKVHIVNGITDTFDCEVDLIDLLSASGTVLQQAITTGTVIVNRRPELLFRIVAKMIRDEEDFQKKRRELNKEIRTRVFRDGPKS